MQTTKNKHSEDYLKYIDTWERIGKNNIWICEADDPVFDKRSIYECFSIQELKEKFDHGNWCLGQGFSYKNLCFINQIEAGDEFLTIKDDEAFESITTRAFIKDGRFESLIDTFLTRTIEEYFAHD